MKDKSKSSNGNIIFYIIGAIIIIQVIYSWANSDSDCVKHGMDEYGYSYEEAKQNCEEAKTDSQVR